MREKLVIRWINERVFERHIENYPKFQKKWLAYNDKFVKVIEGYLDDPAFKEFYDFLRSKVDYVFSYIVRKYDKKELLNAKLLQLSISAAFEPTGEELGTQYKYPCLTCKAGRRVSGNLVLNLSKVPRGKDIAKTIAQDEWIVSERLAFLIRAKKIKGAELKPVEHYSSRKPKSAWNQLILKSTVKVDERTKYGDPFRPNLDVKKIKAPCKHTIKHVIFSELYIKRDSWDKSDIAKTDLYFGGHMNLVYPWPAILISQRFYRLLKEHDIKGYQVKVAHLV